MDAKLFKNGYLCTHGWHFVMCFEETFLSICLLINKKKSVFRININIDCLCNLRLLKFSTCDNGIHKTLRYVWHESHIQNCFKCHLLINTSRLCTVYFLDVSNCEYATVTAGVWVHTKPGFSNIGFQSNRCGISAQNYYPFAHLCRTKTSWVIIDRIYFFT